MEKLNELKKLQKQVLNTLFPWGNLIEDFDPEKLNDILQNDILPPEILNSTNEYLVFRRELTEESDRGAALLASSHLEFMLEQLLRKKLIGSKKEFKLLFGFTGPLGTFSSRILMSYSLGLISKNTLHDVQIIRRIRNEFGHNASVSTFENQKVTDLCSNLVLSIHAKNARPRSKFLNVVSAISGQIEAEIMIGEKFEKHQDFNIKSRQEKFDRLLEFIKRGNDGK